MHQNFQWVTLKKEITAHQLLRQISIKDKHKNLSLTKPKNLSLSLKGLHLTDNKANFLVLPNITFKTINSLQLASQSEMHKDLNRLLVKMLLVSSTKLEAICQKLTQ